MSRSSSGFAFHPRSKFDAYLEGQLSTSADHRMRAHLAGCTTCATEVDQRSSALSITRQLDSMSATHLPRHVNVQSTTVMESSGIAGWKVLAGAGVIGVVVLVGMISLWVLGGQDGTYDTAESSTSSLIPQEVEVVQANPQDLIHPTPSSDSTKVPSDFGTSSPQLSYNSAPLGMDGTPVRLTSVSDLRSAGWTVPQFQALGMAFESAVVDQQDGQVYVVSLFNGSAMNSGDQTVVRECRAEDEDGTVAACTRLDFTTSAASEISLPVAENVWLYTYPDGSWTAYMATNKSQYRVDSTSNADYAGGIMSTLYLEEKSRLRSENSDLSEGLSHRFERGLDRLMGR